MFLEESQFLMRLSLYDRKEWGCYDKKENNVLDVITGKKKQRYLLITGSIITAKVLQLQLN
jgi:hypothetical protein